MEFYLPLIWAGIIAFAVIMYVVMDGFDLGVGILFPFAPGDKDRDLMMNSVAPVWDGNETWLVLGGTGLLAAYPLAYAVILPALYIPVIVMLIGLIFRGVAFEFRFKAETSRRWWDIAFNLGSLVAAFSQGIVLGAFIQGFEVEDRRFAGGAFDWLTPFALFCGIALIAGYALLGCTWIVMKTTDGVQRWARRLAIPLLAAVLGCIVAVSLWTPLLDAEIARRWFSWPNILLLSPVPLVTGLTALGIWRAVRRDRDVQPFLLSILLFLLSYGGLAISLFPNVVPPDISIWEASADPASQLFLLWGTLVIVPIVLGYTAHTYYVFRGKLREGEGYH